MAKGKVIIYLYKYVRNMKNKSSTQRETISKTKFRCTYLSSPVTPIKRKASDICKDRKSVRKLSNFTLIYLRIFDPSMPNERLLLEPRTTITQSSSDRLLEPILSKLILQNSVLKIVIFKQITYFN